MIVLGYNGFSKSAAFFDAYFGSRGTDRHLLMGHDAGAALFKDGILTAAVEEERFDRIKKSSDFPRQAIDHCLRHAGVAVDDIDLIAVPWDCGEQWISAIVSHLFAGHGPLGSKIDLYEKLKTLYFQVASHEAVMEDFNRRMGTDFGAERFLFVPHHLAHMAGGYFVGGCRDSAFLVTDGRGEAYSAILGEIDRDHFDVFDHVSIQNSIGILYRNFTRYLGFTPNSDEYKVMALASFVKEPPVFEQDDFIELLPEGRYRIKVPDDNDGHTDYYRFFAERFGAPDGETAKRMAWVAQHLTEVATWHQVDHLQARSRYDHLYIDGGVALNCVNNGKLLARSRFKDAHVGFAASDTGVAIGAAAYVLHQQKALAPSPITPYLGPEYTAETMRAALAEKADQIEFRELAEEELLAEVSAQLLDKQIVGWFQGRMESGPRALGNRSILASPHFSDMKDIINAKVKYREPFRPFAGVMVESAAADYFELGKKGTSPYMTFVFDVKPHQRQKVLSALHVDDTSRLQTVNEQQNPKLYRLLQVFGERSGTPCLINTSFNVAGEPIVCSPRDAVRTFLNSGIDVLVMGNYIAHKK